MIDLFSVLLRLSGRKMTNMIMLNYSTRQKDLFSDFKLSITDVLFFTLAPDFLFNSDTLCDFKGLILSTTFHAVPRKKPCFKYLITCTGCSL